MASSDGERQALVDAVAATQRKDAAAWLALLRYDYAAAKAVGTKDAWMKLATTFRGASSLPPDQRRTEAHAMIQIDEARIKIHLNTDDARAFLKSARTIPKGRENWTLWRCSIIYEARSGDTAVVRGLLTECRSRFASSCEEYQLFDRLAKDGGVSAIARMSIDDDIPAPGSTAALPAVQPLPPMPPSLVVPPSASRLASVTSVADAAGASFSDAPLILPTATGRASVRPSALSGSATATAANSAAAKKLGLPMRIPKAQLVLQQQDEAAGAAATASAPAVAPDAAVPVTIAATSVPSAPRAPVPPPALRPAVLSSSSFQSAKHMGTNSSSTSTAAAASSSIPPLVGDASHSGVSSGNSLLPPGITAASIAAGLAKKRRTMGRMSLMMFSSLSPVKESDREDRADADGDGISVPSSKGSGGSKSSGGSNGGNKVVPAPAAPIQPYCDSASDSDGADMAVDDDDEEDDIPLVGMAPAAAGTRPSMASTTSSSVPSVNTTHALLGTSVTLSSFATSGIGHNVSSSGGGNNGRPSALAIAHNSSSSNRNDVTNDGTTTAGGPGLSLTQLDPTVTYGQAMGHAASSSSATAAAAITAASPAATPAASAPGAIASLKSRAAQFVAQQASQPAPTGRSSVFVGKRKTPEPTAAPGSTIGSTSDVSAVAAEPAPPRNSGGSSSTKAIVPVPPPAVAAAAVSAQSKAAAAAPSSGSAAPKVKFALPDYIKSFDAKAMAAARGGGGNKPSAASTAAAPSAPKASAALAQPVSDENEGERGREKRRRTSRGSNDSNGSGGRSSRSRSRGKTAEPDATGAEMEVEPVQASSTAASSSAAVGAQGLRPSASASSLAASGISVASKASEDATIVFKKPQPKAAPAALASTSSKRLDPSAAPSVLDVTAPLASSMSEAASTAADNDAGGNGVVQMGRRSARGKRPQQQRQGQATSPTVQLQQQQPPSQPHSSRQTQPASSISSFAGDAANVSQDGDVEMEQVEEEQPIVQHAAIGQAHPIVQHAGPPHLSLASGHPPLHPQSVASSGYASSASARRPPQPSHAAPAGGLDESAEDSELNESADSDTSGFAAARRGAAAGAAPHQPAASRQPLGTRQPTGTGRHQHPQQQQQLQVHVDEDATFALLQNALGGGSSAVPSQQQQQSAAPFRNSGSVAAAAAGGGLKNRVSGDENEKPSAATAAAAAAGSGGIMMRNSGSSSSLVGDENGPGSSGSSLTSSPFSRLLSDKEIVYVGGRPYLKLDMIGKGGSSRVYRVLGEDMVAYALKRVRLSRMDAASVATYTNEINLLRRLNAAGGETARHIIRLVDAEVTYESRCIHIVMEYGQIDLNKLLVTERERMEKEAGGPVGAPAGNTAASALPFSRALRSSAASSAASSPAGSSSSSAAAASVVRPCVDENLLRLVWQQMLHAVHAIHEARIVHGDLKPANFVFVEGTLKLIDFGIAKAINNDTTNIVRDSQVGTLNYMSPEAILDVSGAAGSGGRGHHTPLLKLGRPSDIWSLGCILYQMVYGRTPFAELPLIQKLHAIVDPSYSVAFPPLDNADLLDVLKACLSRDPSQRLPIAGPAGLLQHPFLRPRARTVTVTVEKEVPVQVPAVPPGCVALDQAGISSLIAALGAHFSHPSSAGGSNSSNNSLEGLASAVMRSLLASPSCDSGSNGGAGTGSGSSIEGDGRSCGPTAAADVASAVRAAVASLPKSPQPSGLSSVAAAAAAAAAARRPTQAVAAAATTDADDEEDEDEMQPASLALAAADATAASVDQAMPPPPPRPVGIGSSSNSRGHPQSSSIANAPRPSAPPVFSAAAVRQQAARLRPTAKQQQQQQQSAAAAALEGGALPGASASSGGGAASSLKAAIQERASSLRHIAPSSSAAAADDKENGQQRHGVAAKPVAPAGSGLEAALRSGLNARFAAGTAAIVASNSNDDTTSMDLTWSSAGR